MSKLFNPKIVSVHLFLFAVLVIHLKSGQRGLSALNVAVKDCCVRSRPPVRVFAGRE